MSHLKTATRAQQPPQPADHEKYRAQACQLQEIYPSWSNDDLHSLLAEVDGDVELAVNRISDGVAEQWGSVTRKKDKKGPSSVQATKESFSGRGDFRGARGGRGGRGGQGRGSAVRGRGGPPRGGAVNGRSAWASSPAHAESGSSPVPAEAKQVSDVADAPTIPILQESASYPNGLKASAGRTDTPSTQPESSTLSISSSWAGTTSASAWGIDTEVNGSTPSLHAPTSKAASKPATSKLSWAQIARPHEKAASTPPLPAPAPAPALVPASPPQVPPPAPLSQAPIPTPEPDAETLTQTWEEPTTAQPPTWDDEPQSSTSHPEPKPEPSESHLTLSQHETEPEPPEELTPEPAPQLPVPKSESALQTSVVAPVLSQGTATPSPKLAGRLTASSHRNSARYKNIDQPVVMPSSFGTGIEKVGMQFGSLNLGGDSLLDPDLSEPEPPTTAPEVPSPPAPEAQAPTQQEAPPPPPPVTAPASTSVASTIFSQQQNQPPLLPSASLHSIPAPSAQVLPQQVQLPSTVHGAAAASPIQQYAQHQHAQQQHQAQQHQSQPQTQQHTLSSSQQHHQPLMHPQHTPQSHSQYGHGLSMHLDPAHSSQSQPQNNAATHSSYFGRGDIAATSPYFHTPTPPVGQGPDSPYGSFGQVGANNQSQQGAHLSGFGQEYPYSDNQRGFYESYPQSAFGNRNILSHDDVKSLQTQQQPPASSGLPPSATQSSQPHGLQGTGQPQGAGTQAPQYSVPYPYYNPYPQSQQYYNYPPYATVPQFKYPTMFQPPAGPGSAPSPATKQPGAGVGAVQPQTNPYSQGLYPQSGYDDYQQHHHSQHTAQHSHSLGLGQGGVGAADYAKPLYGGAGQGGMQSFMGLGGQGSGAGGPNSNAGGPRTATSPETPYKPYASKDVSGVGAGRGGQQPTQVQGQPQSQGQGHGGQGPQGQGFYGGARFSGTAGGAGGVGGPQQNAHHPQGGQHIYPQGGNDASFYQYRGQQQAYWS